MHLSVPQLIFIITSLNFLGNIYRMLELHLFGKCFYTNMLSASLTLLLIVHRH